VDFGAEGGVYRSPFGELAIDESGQQLTFKISPANLAQSPSAALTPDALSRYLLQMATPGAPHYRADFADLLSGVTLGADNSVVLNLKRVYVRPEAMLQIPPPAAASSQNATIVGPDTYAVADHAPDQVAFTINNTVGGEPTSPRAIVEQTMTDDAAVSALLAGEIDVLDRVPPWQIERLRASQAVRVQAYRLPTVHVLIPNMKKPLMARREFRRALCFGIDRRFIVQRVLLGGATMAGYDVVSGPFPAGTSLTDPVRYAYNSQVAARPFEPRLAAILATVAWAGVKNPNAKAGEQKDPGPIPELTLAHPNDPIARVACQSIRAQLVREGIPIKLQEFTADELLAGKVDYDFRYAELAVWEPVSDARLLLGPGGLAGGLDSPYLDASLRSLDAATNWKDVRTRLAELHEIANHELPIIPLWQTVNYFAYRTSIRGIGEAPLTLYQNIGQWSASPGSPVASAESLTK
jgi:ABC-type transport system substrate-binding protein